MTVVNLYAPGRRSADELHSTFVAREALLEELLRFLKAQWSRKTHQHILLIGPRGIGKSHMLAMLRVHVDEHPRRYGRWLPVTFPQEGYGVLRLRQWIDLWAERAVQAAKAEGLETAAIEESAGKARGAADGTAIAARLGALRTWARAHGRRYLLLAENLDRLFGERVLKHEQAQKQLRELLLHEPDVLLVGTSPTAFRQLTKGAEPMYELFQVHRLEELSRDDMAAMLRSRAEYDTRRPGFEEPAGRVLHALDARPGRITTLFELTGGNPRFVEMLYRLIASSDESSRVEQEFLHLLDEVTPYFQHRTADLTDQQEEVLMALVRRGYQASATQIAAAIDAPVNAVTKQLNRLEEAGFVEPLAKKGRSTPYALRERLYRYWLQYHEEATEPLVRLIVDFLAASHTSGELAKELEILRNAAEVAAKVERESLDSALRYLDEAYKAALIRDIRDFSAQLEVLAETLNSATSETARLHLLEEAFGVIHDRLKVLPSTAIHPESDALHSIHRSAGSLATMAWFSYGSPEFLELSVQINELWARLEPRAVLPQMTLAMLTSLSWTDDPTDERRKRAEQWAGTLTEEKSPSTAYLWVLAGTAEIFRSRVRPSRPGRERARERFSRALSEASPSHRAESVLAAAGLVALGDERYVPRLLDTLFDFPNADRPTALRAAMGLLNGIPPGRLRALLDDMERSGLDGSTVAPYVDALDMLTGARTEALDRYPPEVLKVLGGIFPALKPRD